MPDMLLHLPGFPPATPGRRLPDALAHAAAALARLDQTLDNHPLLPAFLYRARLDAVRRQAGTDGLAIDPWHLAALLEGLRLRMDAALRIIDRGAIFEAARHALQLHQWLTAPDFDQEGEVQRAEAALAAEAATATPLLAAASGFHAWIDAGGTRAPIRAALVRFWMRQLLLRAPVPLTGAAALRADVAWQKAAWTPAFLDAVAGEAEDALLLLAALERVWNTARRGVAGRRRNSRAATAIDILAATPLVSASTLAAGLGMAVNNAAALLESFCAGGIAVEVTHRSKRRLFGLAGLAPLRDGIAPPKRPMPGRGRGRPPILPDDDAVVPPPALPEPPFNPRGRQDFDYGEIETWMVNTEQTIRRTRLTLAAIARREPPAATGAAPPGSASSDTRSDPARSYDPPIDLNELDEPNESS
jgi:hypothetical protein